jgi:prefoldin subunit 5
MALNDDYFDVLEALNRLRKNKAGLLAAFRRLMQRTDELEEENEQLRAAKRQCGAE